MNKAKELLKELQDLDMDIQSRIDEINELEAVCSQVLSGQVSKSKVDRLEKLTMSILSW